MSAAIGVALLDCHMNVGARYEAKAGATRPEMLPVVPTILEPFVIWTAVPVEPLVKYRLLPDMYTAPAAGVLPWFCKDTEPVNDRILPFMFKAALMLRPEGVIWTPELAE